MPPRASTKKPRPLSELLNHQAPRWRGAEMPKPAVMSVRSMRVRPAGESSQPEVGVSKEKVVVPRDPASLLGRQGPSRVWPPAKA